MITKWIPLCSVCFFRRFPYFEPGFPPILQNPRNPDRVQSNPMGPRDPPKGPAGTQTPKTPEISPARRKRYLTARKQEPSTPFY